MENINQNTFVDNMMRFAASNEDPELIIQKLVQYLCENLKSDRAYIFERNAEGTFDNTYEFCREGVISEKENLQKVPYEGCIEYWYAEYDKAKHVLIYDIDKYEAECKTLYDILKPQGIRTLVTGPIISDGEYIGFYGVDNPPEGIMRDIAELIEMMEFIIGMMIRIRDYARTIANSAEIDALTGCKNRKALESFYERKQLGNIGLVMCDLNGLKNINDEEGHMFGDRHICNLSNTLKEVFGNGVYRLGGDEFLAVKMPVTEAEMSRLSRTFRELCMERDISVSIGCEYEEKEDVSFEELVHRVDNKMYTSKREYYSGINHDRRANRFHKSDVLNNLLFEAFAESSDHVYIYVVDLDAGITRWSKNCVNYFGLPDEYTNKETDVWIEHVHEDDKEAYLADITGIFTGTSSRHSCQYRAKNCYGEYVWVECKGSVVRGANGNNIFAGLMTRLDIQSIYDPLTGLQTKLQLYNYDFKKEKGVILLIGIDYFKTVISTYGYENGDAILVQLGKAFSKMAGEKIKAYRLNGDEFIFILPEGTKEDTEKLFDAIYERVGTIYLNNDTRVDMSYSGGAVVYPLDGGSADEILNRLEVALAYVKRGKRGELIFYSDEIQAGIDRIHLLKKGLKNSIANNFDGFELYYQPWMDKEGKHIVGCEALLRWKGDQIKDSYPGEFIPLLEEMDDIVEVGRFVMHEALKQQKVMDEIYGKFYVSFNVSYRQFLVDDYAKELSEAAKLYGVDPTHVIIELTESCRVQYPSALASVFRELQSLGFNIALDDFGTGYASLEMFRQLPCDSVKIDHSFVRELSNEGHDVDFAIIDTILSLCKKLGKQVVVEGVENKEVDTIIKDMNTGYLQGYYYSKPVCREEFMRLVEENYRQNNDDR